MKSLSYHKIRNKILFLVIGLIVIGSIIFPLYKFKYLRTGESAIIFIIGEPLMEEIDWSYNENQINELERQYGEFWRDLSLNLGERWGWDIYYYYRSQFNLNRYRYEKLFLLFEGHQTNEEKPSLKLTNNQNIEISSISKEIVCRNLTILVQACYSLKWLEIFTHENISKIYTSDLENKKSAVIHIIQGGTIWNESVTLLGIESYAYFFVNQLINGANLEQANETATIISYQKNLTSID